MVSILRSLSEEGSEPDLDLHVSDTEEDSEEISFKEISADLGEIAKTDESQPATPNTSKDERTDDLIEENSDKNVLDGLSEDKVENKEDKNYLKSDENKETSKVEAVVVKIPVEVTPQLDNSITDDTEDIPTKDDIEDAILKGDIKDNVDDIVKDGNKDAIVKDGNEDALLKDDAEDTILKDDVEDAILKDDIENVILKDDNEDDILKNDNEDDILKDDNEDDILKDDNEDDMLKDDNEDDMLKDDNEDDMLKDDIDDNILKGDIEDAILRDDMEEAILRDDKEDAILRDDKEDAILRDDKEDAILKDDIEDAILKDDVEDAILKDDIEDAILKDDIEDDHHTADSTDPDAAKTSEAKEDRGETLNIKNLDSTSNDSDQNHADNDESDLLWVMEEKAADVDETEFNKSVIADEEEQANEQIKDDSLHFEISKSPPSSPVDESQDNADITDEIATNPPDELMDIGDIVVEGGEEEQTAAANDILDAVMATPSDSIDLPEQSSVDACQIVSPDGESNKENVEESSQAVGGIAVSNITEIAPREASRKRQSVDNLDMNEKPKKFKAEKKINANSLSQFMLDKSLKGMTREKLEVFVLQKICESLIYKTEVADLQKTLRDKENMIDSLRKEVVSLGKQAKDLNIVHDKIIQDLARFTKNPERPLLVPRITRSVGLQATSRDLPKKVPDLVTIQSKPGPVPIMPKPARTAPIVPVTPPSPARAAKKVVYTQPPQPVRSITASSPRQQAKAIVPKTPVAKSPAKKPPTPPPKKADNRGGVIDLTSDEEKKFPQLSQLLNGSKVVTPPNGHKFVVVNGQSVMVKLASQNNFIMNPNAMKVISTNASIRALQSSVLKATNIANTKTVFTAHPRASVGSPAAPRFSIAKPVKTHPAPFPVTPQIKVANSSAKQLPPRPQLKLSKTSCGKGIVLSWKMPYKLDLFEEIASYQLYAYQETKAEPTPESWGKIGDVKALPLPMAVTLTQFALGNRYYFAVRAVDILMRLGPFSEYQTISL